MMVFDTFVLPAGTPVFHGTAAEFDELEGPAWVSTAISVADTFKTRHSGARPRILAFQTTRPLNLMLIENATEFGILMAECRYLTDCDWEDVPDRFAELYGRDFDGWIVPDNYPDGDDILLINPEKDLEYLGTLGS